MDSQRRLVQRIEHKLESTVDDAFARVFGGAIVPEELAAALRREAGAGLRSLEGNRLLAANEYVITLGEHDYANVSADPDRTADTFSKHLAEHIDEEGWQTYGDVVVRFRSSSDLHTGQVRVHGTVRPNVSPHPTVGAPRPPQSDQAFSAEPGVPSMTDNPSYHGGHGQGWPGDDYYDENYGRHQESPRTEQDPGGTYPPEPGAQPPGRDSYPGQGPGDYPPPRRPEQGGGYPEPGGYPGQRPGGYPPPPYEQHSQGGYGTPGTPGAPPRHDPGRQQPRDGNPPPGGGQPGYGDYGRPPAGNDDYARPEQRPPDPEQSGYDQGGPPYSRQDYPRQDYGRQDYGQPDYGRYGDGRYGDAPAGYDYGRPAAAGGGYQAPPATGYGDAAAGFDYRQPAAAGGGYDSYGPQGYAPPATVTLRLDDGSGRTYQLHEGSNVVGRGQDAQFRLPDTGVSRRHLEIRWDGQVALLSDLNSTNGTTVNNAPVQEWQLADGDVIRVGHSEIVVHVH